MSTSPPLIRSASAMTTIPRWGRITRTGSSPPPPRVLLVQQRRDLLGVDVRLVVPEESGVDVLRQLLALERLDGRLHALVADPDRVLRDRPGHDAAPDRVQLGLARVVADDGD